MIRLAILAACLCPAIASFAQKPAARGNLPKATPQMLMAAMHEKKSPGELQQIVFRMFGKNNLLMGKAGARIEGRTAAWAIIDRSPARIVRQDGSLVGEMCSIGSEGLQALAIELPNFTEIHYRIEAAGSTRLAGAAHIEHFDHPADSQPQPGVPQGRLEKFDWTDSRIFPNTVRAVIVYIPAQYKAGDEAALMVWQDGSRHCDPAGQMRAAVVFDNLIHRGDMPVTIGVFIDPGRRPKQKPEEKAANRGFEYDSLGDAYARFLLEEILPAVEQRCSVKLKADPASRAIAGGSSGGICAFTAAWERPDQFGKVLSWVGSFVNLRGGHVYPSLIRLSERKPIRVYLLDGANDLDNQFGNWPIANRQMEAALKFMKYDCRIDWTECFHGSKGMSAKLPEALRWLWRKE